MFPGKHVLSKYSLEVNLTEALQMNTHNICFSGEKGNRFSSTHPTWWVTFESYFAKVHFTLAK